MNLSRRSLQWVLLLTLTVAPVGRSVFAAPVEPAEDQPKLDPRLQKYFAAKEQHARRLVDQLKLAVDPQTWDYFAAGIKGNWSTVLELYHDFRRRSGQYNGTFVDPLVRTPVWQPVNETYGAYEAFAKMDVKFVGAFARDIVDSIPRGGIYFGGTDPGRWIITAFCKSHADADPFFVLTQNALADGTYLGYLRAMYGTKLYMPTDADSKAAFDKYLADAKKRLKAGQLKPGENVSLAWEEDDLVAEEDNKVQVSGQVAVMSINALIAKTIFDKNPGREFYIEESFPLDWMYPYLSPHGLIMKINRQPLKEMTDAIVEKDRKYWQKQTAALIGDWLREETSVKAIGEFADLIYGQRDFEGFKGDVKYVNADASYNPQNIYAKLRVSQASVYAWHADHATTPKEKQRMVRAADFAFRQAIALGPKSPEAVARYVNFLRQAHRLNDARLVAKTSAGLSPGDGGLHRLAEELEVE